MKSLLLLAAFAATLASAADITGTWKGTADTPLGPSERTFVFKVDGNKLTGETTSNLTGKSEIENGKIDGDQVSFTVTVKVEGYEGKLNYTGKVSGNEIRFHVESTDGNVNLDYTVKKVS